MATVRAQRLLNNIIDGTTNATALQTALGTSSTRADFQQVVNERSRARMIAATTNGAAAVGQSATALLDFFESPSGSSEFGKNPTKMNPYIGAPIAASDALMGAYTNSNANLVNAASVRNVGAPIYTSSFAKNYSSRFIVNGTTWNLPSMPNASPANSGSSIVSLAANGSTLVFCIEGTQYTNSTAVYTSTNGGNSWTAYQVNPSATGNINSITYGAGLFLLVGTNGRCFTSPDGVTWTQRTTGTGSDLWRVRYANGRFVAVGNSANIFSTDGITWSAASGSISGASLYGLEYVGSNTWIALWTSSNILRSTNNGGTWSTLSVGSQPFSIASDGDGIVICGIAGGQMVYSTNYGSSWTAQTIGGGISTSWGVWGVAYYAGNFLFASNGSTNIAFSRQSLFTTATAFTANGAAGANPVPSFGGINTVNSLFVVDGRLCSNQGSTNFMMSYRGQ